MPRTTEEIRKAKRESMARSWIGERIERVDTCGQGAPNVE